MADGVDTSIYGNLNQQGGIGQLAQFAGAMNAMNQNKLFQQEYNAKMALGPIMQSAVDPQTGELDFNKYFMGVASNPQTAFLAPQVLQEGIQRNLTQQQTALVQMDRAIKSQGYLGNIMAPLLNKGPGNAKDEQSGITDKDIMGAAQDYTQEMRDAGLWDKQTQDLVMQVITHASGLKSPDRYKLIQSIAQRSLQAKDSLQQTYGQLTTTDTGGGTQVSSISQATGKVTPQAFISKTPTPSDLNTQLPTKGPQGETIPTTAQQVQPFVSGGQPQITQGPNAEVVQQASAPTQVSAPPTPQGASVAGPSGTPTAVTQLPIVQQQALEAEGNNMGQYEKDLQGRAQVGFGMLQSLQEAKDQLSHMKPGGGGHFRAELGSALQAVGADQDTIDGIANGSLSGSQIYDKLMTTNTMQVLRQAIGGQGRLTNLEFEKFLDSNPNLNTDPRAAAKMIDFLMKMAQLPVKEQAMYEGDGTQANPGFKYFALHGGPHLGAWPTIWMNSVLKSKQYTVDPLSGNR